MRSLHGVYSRLRNIWLEGIGSGSGKVVPIPFDLFMITWKFFHVNRLVWIKFQIITFVIKVQTTWTAKKKHG